MNLNAASYDLTPLTFPLWSLLRIFLYFVTSGHCLLSARDINVAQLSLSLILPILELQLSLSQANHHKVLSLTIFHLSL